MERIEIVNGDKLILRGLMFHGFHGVKPEEKTLGQKFLIDIDAWMDLGKAGKTDCLDDTISYTDLYRIAKDVVEGTPQNLLESVAHLISSTILAQHPRISAVRVKVRKPHVAVHQFMVHLITLESRFTETEITVSEVITLQRITVISIADKKLQIVQLLIHMVINTKVQSLIKPPALGKTEPPSEQANHHNRAGNQSSKNQSEKCSPFKETSASVEQTHRIRRKAQS